MIINTSNLNEARSYIQKSKEKPIILQAQNDAFNRKILEYGRFQILLFPDNEKRKDKLKQADSGLNHVLAKIATKNKVTIGYDLEKLRQLEKKEKAIQLSRLIQNIKICRKAKTKLILLNAKDKKDAFDFLISLGASTQQSKDALS